MLKKLKDKLITVVQYAIKAVEVVLSVVRYLEMGLKYLRKLLDVLRSV